jgi:hypothetical protein
MRSVEEIRREIVERAMEYLLREGKNLADADYTAALERACADMAREMDIRFAQRTAALLRDAGIKPH